MNLNVYKCACTCVLSSRVVCMRILCARVNLVKLNRRSGPVWGKRSAEKCVSGRKKTSGIGRGKVCMATRHFWWLEIDAPMHVLQQYVEHVHACASVRMCSVCLAGNTSGGTRDCPINPHRGRKRPDGALM
jgi:hypothetical protein